MEVFGLRIGNGVDFHSFAEESGNFTIPLGGVLIPSKHKINAHSDGDVILHAFCEAVFGATSNGNIGTHFPPSDVKWKGASSTIFALYAIDLLTKQNGKLINVDFTVICEEPKIMPFANEIKLSLAKITGLSVNQIGVKATTTEQMGFLGRKEGIGAIATVLLYMF
jgi:2-C-methyl-D-erythritol 2,4-cyclodiphosphate synthase